MTVSDALPVQFWDVDEDTFNEKVIEGIHHVDWCAPWNCDDEIKYQGVHTSGQVLYLVALDSEQEILYSARLNEVASGVYQKSIIPSDEDICDEKIQLKILDSSDGVMLAPTSWTDQAPWNSKTATQFIYTDAGSPYFTPDSYMSLTTALGDRIQFSVTVNISGTYNGELSLYFSLTDSIGNLTSTTEFTEPIAAGVNNFDIDLTAASAGARLIVVLFESNPGTGSISLTLTIPVNQILNIVPSTVLKKSDGLDIKESHPDTFLITYSNDRDYAGLIYNDNDSPSRSFYLRVPCRFFHEIEPEEDEAIELTESVVTTSSEVKTQRKLEVKHVPYYFHKKLRRVLKHQSLTIDGLSWKKEEKYEVNEGEKRWPLKTATCYLTETNSVVRNVL